MSATFLATNTISNKWAKLDVYLTKKLVPSTSNHSDFQNMLPNSWGITCPQKDFNVQWILNIMTDWPKLQKKLWDIKVAPCHSKSFKYFKLTRGSKMPFCWDNMMSLVKFQASKPLNGLSFDLWLKKSWGKVEAGDQINSRHCSSKILVASFNELDQDHQVIDKVYLSRLDKGHHSLSCRGKLKTQISNKVNKLFEEAARQSETSMSDKLKIESVHQNLK